jgi:hypothetical protein
MASASELLSAEDGRTGGSSADEACEEWSSPLMSGVLFWLDLGLELSTNCCRALEGSRRTTFKELEKVLAPPARERPFGVPAGMMDYGRDEEG